MKRTHLVDVAVLLGFCLFLPGAVLFKPDTIVLPLLVKTALASAIVFFTNVYVLLPRYSFRGRYSRYLVSVAALSAAVLGLLYLLRPWRDTSLSTTDEPFVFVWLMPIVGMFFVSTIYAYFRRDRISRKREIDLTHQNIEFEMKFLKSQINPHFLFNALNNIYALSVIKSERTADMILKLSDMLRFSLYDSDSKKVKLGREIEYIVNFIEFQKLKLDSEPNIKLDTLNCNTEMMIEPMLMIPFIENSFKHGNIDNVKRGWLQVEIKTLGPILVFKVKNSLPAIAINKDVVGGIGVENVRKRLDILYPGRYEFNTEVLNNTFSVFMKIDTCATDV